MRIFYILIVTFFVAGIGWMLLKRSLGNRRSGLARMKSLFAEADRNYFDFIDRKLLSNQIPVQEKELISNQALVILRPTLQSILSLSRNPDLHYSSRPQIESKYLKALAAKVEQLMDANNYQTLLTIEELSELCRVDIMADLQMRLTDIKLNRPI